jgi:hypothetical protein
MADFNTGLHVVDVRTPSTPRLVAHHRTPGDPRQLVVLGSHLLVADGGCGVRILDISRPEQLVEVGATRAVPFAYGVAAAGRLAYVAAGSTDWPAPCPTAAPGA